MFDIKEELKKLPDSPGVYLHKDKFGQIIYVGKAVNLSRRVHQYFQSPKNMPPKVRAMVQHVAEFEYITTGTEMEALILECNLIKKHRPKYNILLRDDKTYPYIKVTLADDYPRILKTRRIINDGSKYFGPFPEAGAVNTIIDLMNSVYGLKRCNTNVFGENFTPCLNYHIHQCKGICKGNVDKEAYRQDIGRVMQVLSGRSDELAELLGSKMNEASEALDFERAAEYRDYLQALRTVTEKQRVVLSRSEDLDIVLISEGLSGAHAILFTVRNGKLSGRESFFLGDSGNESREELLGEFIKQYYYDNVMVPKEILTALVPQDSELLEEFLSRRRGSKVVVTVPARGEKRALLELVRKDLDEMVKNLDERAKLQQEKEDAVRRGLSDVFGRDLADSIHRVEAYDISNINGVDSVAGMVVFEDGRPLRKAYRRFRIKTVEGADDYASLQEVLFRRFKQAQAGNPSFTVLPDLILMDGGEGQVNAALEVLTALKVDIPVAGMAKDDKHRTRALVYNGAETPLKGHSDLFAYVGSIQEEVHRFAIDYHHKLRGKAMTRSVLDSIPGVGEKRRTALLRQFGSVENIKNADVYELSRAPGMNMKVAEDIKEYFACHPTGNKL